jgi:hypothetical protein
MREIEELKLRLELAEYTFKGIEQNVQDLGGVDFAPLALFRHIMSMADGILILAEKVTRHPMFPLFRSMFEGYLNLKYILQESLDPDVGFSKKSRAWKAFAIYEIMKKKEMIETDTNRGEDFLNCLKKRGGGPFAESIVQHIISDAGDHETSKDFSDLLKKPDLYEFYLIIESAQPKPPYFFNIFHPRMTIEVFSKLTRDWCLYKVIYADCSETVHAKFFRQLFQKNSDGSWGFGPLRSSDNMDLTLSGVDGLLGFSLKFMRQHYNKELAEYLDDPASATVKLRLLEIKEALGSFAKMDQDAE